MNGDHTGIIRDIMQNHLLQVLVLCAMEPPASDAPSDIQKAKVEVLKAMSIPSLDDAFLAQYTEDNFMSEPGYLEDPGVPDDSVTPTFAAIVLKINNERWKGVPFVMKAGKGLDERLAEVRVRYKSQPYNKLLVGPQAKNELVCRIQPDEVPSGVRRIAPFSKKKTTTHHRSWRRSQGDASRRPRTPTTRETAAGALPEDAHKTSRLGTGRGAHLHGHEVCVDVWWVVLGRCL